MSVFANGDFVTRLHLGESLGEYEWTLPAEVVRPGLNELRLHFSVLAPADAGLPAPMSLVVRSAGMEVGDFGHIYLNGREQSPNGRGYNVVVIDRGGGTVLDRAVFDTFASEEASRAMLAFMERLPAGVIVAVAVRDEASLRLQPEAIEALHLIGARGDLRGRFRWSHAVIGVKGAEPGRALEAMHEHWPVTLSDGPPLTEPYIALGLQWLRFDPAE
jgi:hypothetical protein